MRIGVMIGFICAASMATPHLAAAADRVAVVDVKKAMQATDHWKEVIKKLEKQKGDLEKVLEADRVALKKKVEELQAQKDLITKDNFEEKMRALGKDKGILAQKLYASQQQLAVLEQGYTGQMLKRIEAIVRALAQRGEYLMVVENGNPAQPNVLYAKKGADITTDVIKAYSENFAKQPLEEPKMPGAQKLPGAQ